MKKTSIRYHDICAGHRIVGHESKCRYLHGHNYRITFYCEGELDALGRVIDFTEIKDRLCMWIENNWDHHMLLWEEDPSLPTLVELDPTVRAVPFNPTAENLAKYLLDEIGPMQLKGTNITLTKVQVEETRKCSAVVEYN